MYVDKSKKGAVFFETTNSIDEESAASLDAVRKKKKKKVQQSGSSKIKTIVIVEYLIEYEQLCLLSIRLCRTLSFKEEKKKKMKAERR